MNINSDFDYLIKLCILGDSGVGKTNLVIRFTENCFSLNIPPTIGYDYKSKKINLKDSNKEAKLQIWDTAGQERYLSLSKTIFQKVNGIILVYDITKKESFDNIPNWIKIIDEHNSTLPILQNIYMKASIDTLNIRATDMEKYVDIEIPCEIKLE